MNLNRKEFLTLAGAVAVAATTPSPAGEKMPLLSRIRGATIGAPDLSGIETLYTSALGYAVVDRSSVSRSLAASWGAPQSEGRNQVVMKPATGEDVFIRAVEITPVEGYKAMSSWGWNSFEIIVNDVDTLHENLLKSAFRHIGGPANLGGAFSSIRASQYLGPAEEVLYFNCETGDRSTSNLPDPGENVGRTNIMILAGPDVPAAMAEYEAVLGLVDGAVFETSIGVVADALGVPRDTKFTMGFSRLGEPGNGIEFDQYPDTTGPRPRAEGQLPPGNAIATFSVEDLDSINTTFIAEPHSSAYEGKRSAAFIGPCGEIVELVEERR